MNIETENLRIKKRLDLIQNSLKMADVVAGPNIKVVKNKKKLSSEKIIAQEVQQVYPKAVEVGRTMKNNGGIEDILTLNITQIEYTLYGAVKELIDNIDVIENEVEEIDTIFNITTQ